VRDGQTVMLAAPVSERIAMMTGQLPVLGNVPGFGPLFRNDSTNTEKRNLLVFLTPTIIDPAGNRVHAPDETPSPRGGTPPQPAR
jgi:general secretion pathway protein D